MRARLLSIDSDDLDLVHWRPKEASFCIGITLEIGIDQQEGSELFHLTACSPAWLAEQAEPLWGASLLIVSGWNYPEIVEVIRRRVGRVEGGSPDTVLGSVAHFAQSEFEGYRPFEPPSL